MDPDAITFAVVCTTIVASVACLVVIGVGARLLLMRAKRQSERPALDENRLQHLEQAIDAIAIEVERISESQRFTTKLLAERDRDSSLH
jgi:hypothetical protein